MTRSAPVMGIMGRAWVMGMAGSAQVTETTDSTRVMGIAGRAWVVGAMGNAWVMGMTGCLGMRK